jgi:hypothetical protein
MEPVEKLLAVSLIADTETGERLRSRDVPGDHRCHWREDGTTTGTNAARRHEQGSRGKQPRGQALLAGEQDG